MSSTAIPAIRGQYTIADPADGDRTGENPESREHERPDGEPAAVSLEVLDGFELDWLTRLHATDGRRDIRCLPARTRVLKRAIDVAGASVLLIVTLPVLLAAVVAIKLTSPGSAFFLQTRVGLNERRRLTRVNIPGHIQMCRRRRANFGRPFTIYKLRTMHTDTTKAGPSTAVDGDSRVTSVGRLLRKMRIDELPQLVNVLRGEMSLVGPRPECIEYMENLSKQIPNYLQRLGLKPGLTGIAQIENGYANDLCSYQRKVAFDLLYLQHCCIMNDLKILLRTVKVVLTGFGAL
ncbi:MAG: sugar transferase [Planctomycetaceae bacterium]